MIQQIRRSYQVDRDIASFVQRDEARSLMITQNNHQRRVLGMAGGIVDDDLQRIGDRHPILLSHAVMIAPHDIGPVARHGHLVEDRAIAQILPWDQTGDRHPRGM